MFDEEMGAAYTRHDGCPSFGTKVRAAIFDVVRLVGVARVAKKLRGAFFFLSSFHFWGHLGGGAFLRGAILGARILCHDTKFVSIELTI